MKLSVLAVALADRPLPQALQFLKERGVQQVEVGCGGYPGKAHCDPAVLLHDEKKLQEFKDTFKRYDLEHLRPVQPWQRGASRQGNRENVSR